jgi:hypothetical protein
MTNPMYLDGPLEGHDYPVTPEQLEGGQIVVDMQTGLPPVVYTITRVQVFGRVLVVASTLGGMPTLETLFGKLISERAQAAAE